MTERVTRVKDDLVIETVHSRQAKEMGARWDRQRDAWTLPATNANARRVVAQLPGMADLSVPLGADVTVATEGLFAFQEDAASRLATASHGGLLWMPPGYGKTATAIAARDALDVDVVVVVCPAPLEQTWVREIARWSHGEVYVLRGTLDYGLADRARWIVVSWDKAARMEPEEWGRGWPLWILDESAMIKSHGSKRFKAFASFRRRVFDKAWLLSGFPVTRHADDLWSQLHVIWPKGFGSYWRFAEQYCVVETNPWARSVVDTKADTDPAGDNDDFVIRVNESELDIPEYLFDPVWVTLKGTQRHEYAKMARTFVADLSDGSQLVAQNQATQLMRLMQMASYFDGQSAKHDVIAELIDSGNYEPPYLVWAHWKEGAAALAKRLGARLVTGDTPPKTRNAVIQDYVNGGAECMVLSTGVGKYGLTLTNTRTVFGMDRTFSAEDHFQSMRRVRRIGLQHCPAMVPVVAQGTADELSVNVNLRNKLEAVMRMTQGELRDVLEGLG